MSAVYHVLQISPTPESIATRVSVFVMVGVGCRLTCVTAAGSQSGSARAEARHLTISGGGCGALADGRDPGSQCGAGVRLVLGVRPQVCVGQPLHPLLPCMKPVTKHEEVFATQPACGS